MKKIVLFLGTVLVMSWVGCKSDKSVDADSKSATPVSDIIPYKVTRYIPHRTDYFTQGLIVHNNQLLESTGSPEEIPFAETVISYVDLKNGQTTERVKLDKSIYFGEGITVLDDKVYQVTYKNRKGFIYDAKTFKKLGEFTYKNQEGWGLTTDGKHIIMSDGTSKLYYMLPPTMEVVKELTVTYNNNPMIYINELEMINGYIYANVWQANVVVKIDPNTGKIVGRLDLSSLKAEADNNHRNSEVTNGIAYDSTTKKVYVTGKLWPTIYEIEFEH